MANAYLWILAGQSNCQGTPGGPGPQPGGAGPDFELAPTVTHPTRALEWEASGGLQELKDNRPGVALSAYQALPGSAWPSFMNVMTAATPDIHVAIRCPRGGSSVLQANTNPTTGNWSTTGTRFTAAIDRANDAIAAINAAGHTLVGVHVIWHGGERDALIGNDLGNFQSTFTGLLGRFRTALARPALKMYVARIGTTTAPPYTAGIIANMATVRGYQDAACAATDGLEMAYTDCVNFFSKPGTNGWMRSDDAHYKQIGYNDMGTGLGTFIAADLSPDPPDPPRPPVARSRGTRLLMRSPSL